MIVTYMNAARPSSASKILHFCFVVRGGFVFVAGIMFYPVFGKAAVHTRGRQVVLQQPALVFAKSF